MKHFLLGAAAICAITGMPGTASADEITATGERIGALSIAVYYDDLNLANQAGVDRLTWRVRLAARQVCDMRSGRMTTTEYFAARACFKSAYERAQDDIQLAVIANRDSTNVAALRAIKVASR